MTRKDAALYILVLLAVSISILLAWQWALNGDLISQLDKMQKYNSQLMLMSGIGHLKSAHIHAAIKVYISGQAIDFSKREYQLKTSFVHFEDGNGDAIHIHATGLTLSHLLMSLGINFDNNCIVIENKDYCNEGNKTLKFYVNGEQNTEFGSRIMADLDSYLISYGSENEADVQKQIDSVANLSFMYSKNK